jgi:hypothetical protein
MLIKVTSQQRSEQDKHGDFEPVRDRQGHITYRDDTVEVKITLEPGEKCPPMPAVMAAAKVKALTEQFRVHENVVAPDSEVRLVKSYDQTTADGKARKVFRYRAVSAASMGTQTTADALAALLG